MSDSDPSSNRIQSAIVEIEGFENAYSNSEYVPELNNWKSKLEEKLEDISAKEYFEKYEKLKEYTFSSFGSALEDWGRLATDLSSDLGKKLLAKNDKLRRMSEDVQIMLSEINAMDSLMNQDFSSLDNLHSMIVTYTDEHHFPSVSSKVWNDCAKYEAGRKSLQYLRNSRQDFNDLAKEKIEGICADSFGDYEIDHVDVVSEDISEIEDYHYDCESVYRVALRGAFLGIDRGTLKIRVLGRVAVMVDDKDIPCTIQLRIKDYSILEKTGDL